MEEAEAMAVTARAQKNQQKEAAQMEGKGDRAEPNNCSGLQCGELGSDQSEQEDPEGGMSGQALGELEVPGPIFLLEGK